VILEMSVLTEMAQGAKQSLNWTLILFLSSTK